MKKLLLVMVPLLTTFMAAAPAAGQQPPGAACNPLSAAGDQYSECDATGVTVVPGDLGDDVVPGTGAIADTVPDVAAGGGGVIAVSSEARNSVAATTAGAGAVHSSASALTDGASARATVASPSFQIAVLPDTGGVPAYLPVIAAISLACAGFLIRGAIWRR